MKIEEAIFYLKNTPVIASNADKETVQKAYNMAIEALEKQIPKKLQNLRGFRGREKCVGTCDTCGYACCSDYGDYCGGCGQAIDFGGD